jgi:peptidoglycan/LPS O-acetylase OafA/YrhL
MCSDNQYKMKKLQFLEGLRGLAAVYVMIHHARWFLWVDYSNDYLKNPNNFSVFQKSLIYILSLFIYGHQAVIFFFILSGFVIHLKYSQNLQSNNTGFDLKNYLKRRFKRIYPPLIFAVILTFILDSIGKYFSFPIYGVSGPFAIIKDNFSLTTLIGNCFLLTDSYVETWGSNFTLWSLKLEWWFYVIFPLFFLLLKRSIVIPFILMFLFYVTSFYSSVWPVSLLQDVFKYMIIWWFGVILADMYVGRIKFDFKYLIPFTLVIPAIVGFRAHFGQQINDLIWGFGFIGFLSIFFYLDRQHKQVRILEKLAFLGSFSFSLYITHAPILVFISGYVLRNRGGLPLRFEFVLLEIIICSAFAYLIHFLIEVPFLKRRVKVEISK